MEGAEHGLGWLGWGREVELGVNRPLTPIVSERTMRRDWMDSAPLLSGFRSGR